MSATRTLRTSLGHQITVFTHDHVGDKIAKQGLYEPENLHLLLALLAKLPNATVLDIGANIGNHSLAFATQASCVHAFEPVPHILQLLQQNVQQNQLTHVHVHPVALSNSSGTATIYMNQSGNMGASSFDQREASTVPVTVSKHTGDDFIAQHGIGKIDLIKIDVEAHEVYVLRGLRQTLQRDRPWLTLEWNDPLTIERLQHSAELALLFELYTPWVLGSNYDRLYWAKQPFGLLRRKWRRWFQPRRALLYPFAPNKLYKNLLFVPKGQEALLDAQYFQP
jgi:FkbM family methyltransferase